MLHSWAAAATLAALPMIAACNRNAAGEVSMAREFAVVQRRDMDIRAEASGLIQPIRLVEVKSKASGEVLRIHVETGDQVQRGALLAEVDPRDVNNAFEQAQADLDVAKARLQTSKAQKTRVEELLKARVATPQELESAALDEANSAAQLIKAETNLMLASERKGDVTIRAPISGTIISRTVEEGGIIASASQNVSGGTVLMLMADLAAMQVRALVDETDLGRIVPGMPAQVSVEAYSERPFEGSVLKIEPQAVVEQNVTMFPVLVLLDNREGLLKPGMNGDVVFQVAQRKGVLTIPNAAIINPRDAEAAGQVLGLSADAIRESLAADNRGGGRPSSDGERRSGDDATTRPVSDVSRPAESAEPAPQNAEPAPQNADCAALIQTMRAGGGAESLSDEERAKMRECRPRGSGGRGRRGGPGSGELDGPGGDADRPATRPAVVFVADSAGALSAKRIMLGLNDYDNSEVVSGLEEGDRVVLISVARMQAQQQEFNNRAAQRATGAFTGQGAPQGGPGGFGGGGGGGRGNQGGRGGR
ncbi:MAG: efflux RND transporter periplasmic adaptor subunit [Longimicrobiales bacterium]